MSNPNLDQIEPAPPLEYGTINVLEKPRKVFFYKKIRESFTDQDVVDKSEDDIREIMEGDDAGDAGIFAVYEQEAAKLNPRFFKQVGVGDGRSFLKYIKDSGVRARQLYPIEKIKEILKGAFKAELEAARGHYQRPIEKKVFIGGVSSDVENADELISSLTKKFK